MRMKKINYKKQQGFSVLAIILVVVAVIVAIGVWALSGQTNTSTTGNSTSDIQASSIVSDGAAIKLSFDNLVINGSSASTVVFVPNVASTATAPNMLDPTVGIQVPRPNANAIRTGATIPEGIWVYNGTTFKGSAVGVAGTADQAILLAGVKDTVCSRINNNNNGTTAIPAVTTITTGAAFVTLTSSPAPTTAVAIDLNAAATAAATAGWTSGCVSANGVADNNLYFRVLKAN
jgi:hypothetical protein